MLEMSTEFRGQYVQKLEFLTLLGLTEVIFYLFQSESISVSVLDR